MAGTFAELLRWPSRELVVLAELTPSLQLSGFTAVGGGSPNTYQVSLPRVVQTSAFPGGVYRRCVGVKENNTALTERASLAAVDANASSWYWDEAAGVLYVRTSTSADPDTFTVYSASVTFYVASTGVVLNRVDGDPSTGIYYWPWLSGDVPQLLSEVEDILSGQKNTTTGRIAMTNGHGFWHTIVAADGAYAWKNKRVRLYVGGSYNGLTLDRSAYAALRGLKVEDVSPDETRCEFRLAPLARATEQLIPPTPYFESSYPNLGDGVRGTKKWVGYGRATIALDLTDTSGNGVWTVADASVQTLFAVHSVQAVAKTTGVRTTLTLTTDYTVNLTTCIVTVVNATYRWQDYDLVVDVTGKPDGAGSYLKTFSAIVRDLLQTFLSVPPADLDTAAFDQAAIDAAEELAMWVKQPRSLASLLSTSEAGLPCLERSVMGTVQETLEGKWTCRIFDPGWDAATVPTLTKEEFAVFSPEPKLETLYSKVNVHYGVVPARDEWSVESASDAKTKYLLDLDSDKPLDVHTYLRNSTDAQRLAQRYRFMSGAVTTEVEFQERGARLAQQLAGDKVLVTFDPAPSADGRWTAEPFELLRLEVTYAPELSVRGRLGNLKGIGKLVGHWAASTVPTYASASASERTANGFWSDSSGYIVPGDPSTLNRSVWW